MQKNLKIIPLVIILIFIVIGYQNCSKGFNILESSSNQEGNRTIPTNVEVEVEYTEDIFSKVSLSETGFERLTKGNFKNFFLYEPQYPLYSDAAAKKRWIYIPKGTKINSSNLDFWSFPKGTVLWKEFTYNNKKIETRIFKKIGNGNTFADWDKAVYIWLEDQSDAKKLPVDDFYSNEMTQKEIYAANQVISNYKMVKQSECLACHSGATSDNPRDIPLGFNYLQLSNKSLNINLDKLKLKNLLTVNPLKYDEIKGSSIAKTAIGYIQGNCAHCHDGYVQSVNYKHRSSSENPEDETIIQTITNNPNLNLIIHQNLDNSKIYQKFIGNPAYGNKMPRFGASIDTYGTSILALWVNNFTAIDPTTIPAMSVTNLKLNAEDYGFDEEAILTWDSNNVAEWTLTSIGDPLGDYSIKGYGEQRVANVVNYCPGHASKFKIEFKDFNSPAQVQNFDINLKCISTAPDPEIKLLSIENNKLFKLNEEVQVSFTASNVRRVSLDHPSASVMDTNVPYQAASSIYNENRITDFSGLFKIRFIKGGQSSLRFWAINRMGNSVMQEIQVNVEDSPLCLAGHILGYGYPVVVNDGSTKFEWPFCNDAGTALESKYSCPNNQNIYVAREAICPI